MLFPLDSHAQKLLWTYPHPFYLLITRKVNVQKDCSCSRRLSSHLLLSIASRFSSCLSNAQLLESNCSKVKMACRQTLQQTTKTIRFWAIVIATICFRFKLLVQDSCWSSISLLSVKHLPCKLYHIILPFKLPHLSYPSRSQSVSYSQVSSLEHMAKLRCYRKSSASFP